LKAEKTPDTSDAQTSASFGSRVAFNGTYAVIIAQSYDALNNLNQLNRDVGAAYVYKKNNGEWTLHSRLIPSTASQGEFITSASINGNTIALGATGSSGNPGRVRFLLMS
jgi:hypothetical protein